MPRKMDNPEEVRRWTSANRNFDLAEKVQKTIYYVFPVSLLVSIVSTVIPECNGAESPLIGDWSFADISRATTGGLLSLIGVLVLIKFLSRRRSNLIGGYETDTTDMYQILWPWAPYR